MNVSASNLNAVQGLQRSGYAHQTAGAATRGLAGNPGELVANRASEVQKAEALQAGFCRPSSDRGAQFPPMLSQPSFQGIFGNVPYAGAKDPRVGQLLDETVSGTPFGGVEHQPSADAIRGMQGLLNAVGIGVGPGGMDGRLGPDTFAAMQRFATLNGERCARQ